MVTPCFCRPSNDMTQGKKSDRRVTETDAAEMGLGYWSYFKRIEQASHSVKTIKCSDEAVLTPGLAVPGPPAAAGSLGPGKARRGD
ncbi:hypothetical protein SKAU_G00008000 [Synaphobranchus kaupii]|uniref:Uncharacterized protein n=1 Tax=Synaphobranchus kaupii TaxID=118154 RepID=A0A9Q1JD18_SYNKA|nr:hypothetical protein SKAU_G00008000 [Synaphobranchus kaupii]